MEHVVNLSLALVAAIHLYFMWLEMFAWERQGRNMIKKSYSTDFFKQTKILAANQGLYNGFMAVGLFWSIYIHDELWKTNLSVFFLSAVIVAGIFGALSADKKIFFIQALPAIISLILVITDSVS